MNDPHVEALLYSIVHEKSVSYDDAQPLECERGAFRVEMKDGDVRFELKVHFSTEEAARKAVEPYIRAWELDAALQSRPGEFQLRFEKAEVIDRSPTPGVVNLSGTIRAGTAEVRGRITVGKQYPIPPSSVILDAEDADVLTIYHRLEGYFCGKEPLPSMAYFCLTMLEHTSRFKAHNSKRRTPKPRQAAACKYGIDLAVLNKVGDLTANKGGDLARKADGASSDLTALELQFLEKAVKIMIRRVAEVAHDPKRNSQVITLSDLPNLV